MKEVEELIRKAKRFLRSAELLFMDGDYDSCVSRCYYAMFFMAEAAIFTKGITAKSHKGIISLFGENFIKTGIFKEYIGKYLREIFESRQIGDYSASIAITEEEAREALEKARKFVSTVEKYLIDVESG